MLARYMISVATYLTIQTGCSFQTSAEEPLGGALTVRGQVVDFQTGVAIATSASVTTSGLDPAPEATLDGAAFTLEDVPANAAFQLLVSGSSYRPTFSPAVVVVDTDLDNVKAPVVSDAFLASLASVFGVTPSPTAGTLLVQLVNTAGAPRAGVTGTSFSVLGAQGPYFLDARLLPEATALTSSSSGWAVFFNVPAGVASLIQPTSATVTLDMAVSPLAAGSVTVAAATAIDGAPVLPVNVSFANQIVPLLEARGCQACHSGNGAGRDLGNLTLDGGSKLIYRELVEERPNTRVRLATPEASMVLTLPSRETPPDRHPTVVFASPRDPDYLKLLVWIREGAKDN